MRDHFVSIGRIKNKKNAWNIVGLTSLTREESSFVKKTFSNYRRIKDTVFTIFKIAAEENPDEAAKN